MNHTNAKTHNAFNGNPYSCYIYIKGERANRLFGLGLRIWDTIGMQRFRFAAIEYICPLPSGNSSTYIPTRSPRHASISEPEKHVNIMFKHHEDDSTSIFTHVICDAEYRTWQRMECFPWEEDTKSRSRRIEKAKEVGNNAICTCS